MAAPFFFSYAHNDTIGTDFVKAFDGEVNMRVRLLTGSAEDGFLDTQRLEAGDEWRQELVDELAACRAIVCLYSPSHFLSEVCGREMQVLLERRLVYKRENAGKRPANIIPVRWQPCNVPWSLPDFQYEKPQRKEYASKGAWNLHDDGLVKEFKAVAQAVAVRVKEAQEIRLPPLPHPLVLGGVRSAFAPPPLPLEEFDAAASGGGPECATFVYVNAPAWDSWPFKPERDPYSISPRPSQRDATSNAGRSRSILPKAISWPASKPRARGTT